VITFLSDYGMSDDFVGVCHGVIATVCPQARVIDITHGIPARDVRAGAVVLREALAYMPRGVHLAIVDPGVGSDRRAVALRLGDGRLLVGPDNGLLWPAAQAAGGPGQAVDIGRSRFALEPVSATFHGRDIFAPVAAQLAGGAELAQVGEPCDSEGLTRLELPRARVEAGTLVAHVLYVDQFGNLQLDAGPDDVSDIELGQRITLEAGSRVWEGRRARTFADVDPAELLVYEDSYRRLAIAVRSGSAAQLLALAVDGEVRIRPLDE
jgi:S-adenosyl-L-methionine hydrolase (adenosine-forming)